MDRTVIVGTGVAAVSAAASMRSAGYEGSITLVGDEPDLPYRRPTLSKEYLRRERDAEGIRIKKEQWYADKRVDLALGRAVTEVDPDAREVRLDDGSSLAYGQLLLATGGRPRLLPGADGSGSRVRTLRALADVPALQAQLDARSSVVVIGAGLIGAELAASARAYGCEVTLLETAPLPLAGLLPESIAQVYADLHRAQYVDLHTGVQVRDVRESGSAAQVSAVDGRTWSADVAVVAIGIEPRVELGERAGLTVDNGIVVDAGGRTSVPDVFASGDVANMPNLVLGGRHRVEHWQNAQNHGTAVGKTMAGRETLFDEVPWCWSDQYGYTLQVTGWPSSHDDVLVRGDLEACDFTAMFVRDGQLVGAVGIGRPSDIRAARKVIGARAGVDAAALGDESVPVPEAVLV